MSTQIKYLFQIQIVGIKNLIERKGERIHYKRERWVKELKRINNIGYASNSLPCLQIVVFPHLK